MLPNMSLSVYDSLMKIIRPAKPPAKFKPAHYWPYALVGGWVFGVGTYLWMVEAKLFGLVLALTGLTIFMSRDK